MLVFFIDIKFFDDDGNFVEKGEFGEMWVKGF